MRGDEGEIIITITWGEPEEEEEIGEEEIQG